jgi:hypothetical protein
VADERQGSDRLTQSEVWGRRSTLLRHENFFIQITQSFPTFFLDLKFQLIGGWHFDLSATLMSLKCFITLETEVSRSVLLMQT